MPGVALGTTGYAIVKKAVQSGHPKKIKINDNLPFRVKFLPGIISGSSPTNPAPIGIAIIGVNNYIL